jgi:hypothetical protein
MTMSAIRNRFEYNELDIIGASFEYKYEGFRTGWLNRTMIST